jgi:hypothetical protein
MMVGVGGIEQYMSTFQLQRSSSEEEAFFSLKDIAKLANCTSGNLPFGCDSYTLLSMFFYVIIL